MKLPFFSKWRLISVSHLSVFITIPDSLYSSMKSAACGCSSRLARTPRKTAPSGEVCHPSVKAGQVHGTLSNFLVLWGRFGNNRELKREKPETFSSDAQWSGDTRTPKKVAGSCWKVKEGV